MFFGDATYILIIPAMILALIAQAMVQRAFSTQSRVRARRGLSGAEAAAAILRSNGLAAIEIEPQRGSLTDHYDPRARRIRLSEPVYGGTSLAAVGVAAHEVGHALQDASGYLPLRFRHGLLGPAQIGSTLAWPLAIAGLLMGSNQLLDAGILLFSGAVLFHVVTLPVELNASQRALAQLTRSGILAEDEIPGARSVLRAAALTYIAAAAVAVMNLIRLLVLRDNRD
ncbi:MAG: zinc metallopeptidase [Candidatus Eisenbacteria bacterium]|nr:zinc metallopeptidase [Candidatus Eisenbacteria bacterium]